MKYNYLRFLVFLGLILLSFTGVSQNNLIESEYGSKIQTYLNQEKETYNLTSSDIADLVISKEFYSKKSKITHVYVNQRYQGITIFNAISSVAIKDNVVFYYANNFIAGIDQRINTTAPQLNAQTAIQRVASTLNLGFIGNIELLEQNGHKFLFSGGSLSKSQIPVELVFYQTLEGDLKLAWDLSIHTVDGKNWWSIRVDAVSGNILDQRDWILSCNFGDSNHTTHDHGNISQAQEFSLLKRNSLLVDGSQYNVFPLPVGAPNDGVRSLVVEPADAVASPYGWHDTNGVSGAEYTISRGNNVWAMEDLDGEGDLGDSVEGTSALNFDFALNLNQPPLGYLDASLTNLFYMNNIMHDVWYQYGFDEASGNFQVNNYGNGGIGNDFVYAFGQDGASLNNATFGTPPDGSNPGMSMFLWTAVGPPGTPLTINNGALAGDYQGISANFGEPLPTTPITANLALVNDSGSNPDIHDACQTITNGAQIAGKIAVIRRGECEFGYKILSAENAGAIAVIMVNNVAGDPITMGPGALGANVTIPSIMVSSIDGSAIINSLENGEVINATLVDAGPYQRDGSLDNLIVAHEYTHGISNRLTGGANTTNCLNSATQMGEGWSDWYPMVMTIKPGDSPEDPRGMATFAVGQETSGAGIREAPYSTSFAINNYTFAYTNQTGGQQHSNGFVWCTMLWDLTWAYIEKYGFDEDVYYGTGGNNKVMQIVTDALKLQPCNPGFVSGRDAILAADMALTGGEDQCMIWEAFANRGLGAGASEGAIFNASDQVEDFTLPPDSDPSLANCTSLSVDEFNQNDYIIYPNPTNGNVYIKTTKNFGNVNLTVTDINGRQVYAKRVDLFGEVEIDMTSFQSGIYVLNIRGEFINSNDKIIKN